MAVLRRLVAALRARWPGVIIELRADSGFALPAAYDYCEREGVAYTIGLIPNPRLEAMASPLLEEAKKRQQETSAQKVRLAGEGVHQAGSWPHPRRVVYKAEALAKGPNPRFVVTTRPDEPLALYNSYVPRGEAEQWIKGFRLGCFGDRLSCHTFAANQFRLLLHAAAYWLLDTLRRRLCQMGAARLQLDTLRLLLLKGGGRVRQLLTRVRLHLASSHPGQPLRLLLNKRLHARMNNSGKSLQGWLLVLESTVPFNSCHPQDGRPACIGNEQEPILPEQVKRTYSLSNDKSQQLVLTTPT